MPNCKICHQPQTAAPVICKDCYDKMENDLATAKNELCQRCGRYRMAHEGACEGCRWAEKVGGRNQ